MVHHIVLLAAMCVCSYSLKRRHPVASKIMRRKEIFDFSFAFENALFDALMDFITLNLFHFVRGICLMTMQ